MEPILSMRSVTKAFPGIVANDKIDLDIYKGEILALIGENGAGKSTLMSILYGVTKPDTGEILLQGKKININSTQIAIKNGIGMVFQHFMLVPPLTVTENVILGMEPKNKIFINFKKAINEVKRISKQYGLSIAPQSKVESISVGMQQRVEILKTLYRGADIIILDEPTAVLAPNEVKELFSTLKLLKSQGKTIIIITHKLKEVMEISDRVSVMRAGKLIGTLLTKQTNENELAKMMVGRDVNLQVEKTEIDMGEVMLEISNLCCFSKKDDSFPGLKGINLSVKKGEILGIAGVEGNGQSELLEALTGIRKVNCGKVLVNKKDVTNYSPKEIKNCKVCNIPEDRHKRGLVLNYSISENLIMGFHYKKPFASYGVIDKSAMDKHAGSLIPSFDIRTPNKDTPARALSGGNQQKIIIAREFFADPDILIASQPTRGVDIGAIEFIHKKLIELRDRGKTILLISAELSEIMSLSDRIAVIYEGEIVDILNAKEATESEIGLLMAGIKNSGYKCNESEVKVIE